MDLPGVQSVIVQPNKYQQKFRFKQNDFQSSSGVAPNVGSNLDKEGNLRALSSTESGLVIAGLIFLQFDPPSSSSLSTHLSRSFCRLYSRHCLRQSC